MSEISSFLTVEHVVLMIGVIISLLQCFMGYRLIRFYVAAAGLIAGYGLFYGIAAVWVSNNPYLPVLAGVIGGVLLCLLSFRLYLVGTFLFCGILAFGAVQGIPVPMDSLWETVLLWAGVAAFVTAGILSVKLTRPFLILVTAAIGSISAVDGLREILVRLDDRRIALMGVALLFFLGAALQFLTSRKKA